MTSVLRKLLLPLAALLVLLLLIYWMAGGFRDQVEPGLERAAPGAVDDAVRVSAETEPAFEAVPASVEAQLAGARQAAEEAQTALGYSRITSPIAGRIVDRFAEPGDTVQPGQKILSLYNPFSLRVEARVREGLALALTPGEELAVAVPAVNKAFTARIEEIVPAADPASRTFEVKASLTAQNGLLPGMYARLRVPAGERERLLVPADRVRRVGQLDVLWVAGENGVERRFVRLGPAREDGQVEILAGVSAGEQVLPPPGQAGRG